MSGVEVIGLILGGLPLIISFAEHYKEGFEPLVRWKRFKYVFRDFVTSVDIQRQMFQLVLKKLLIRVQLEPEEKQRLLTRADYEGWRRDDVVEALKLRLGDLYQASMDLLKAMGEDLTDLQAIMSLKDGSIDWAKPGEKQWKYQAKRIQLSFSENGTRTVQSLEKKIQDLKNLLDLLDSTNDTLDGMKTISKDTTWGKLFENIRRQVESLHSVIKHGWKCHCEANHMAGLQLQNRKASDSPPCFTMSFVLPESGSPIHKIQRKLLVQLKDSKENQGPKRPQPVPVQDNYITTLRTNFDAKLSSDPSLVTLPIRPGMSSTSSSLSTFSLGSIFTKSETNTTSASSTLTTNGTEIPTESQSSWRAMRKAKAKKKIRFLSDLPPEADNAKFVKPCIDSTEEQTRQATPPPVPEEALNPNTKIDSLCSTLKAPYLDRDYLDYLSDDAYQQHEFRLLKDTTSSSQALEETSLEDLLANKGQMSLSRQKRYKIASVLASSLLQLQSTPWLAETLEKKNILFYRRESDVLVEEPFINHSFAPTRIRQDEQNPGAPRTLPRKTLTSLGILLLELCFGDAIENQTEMRKSHLSSDGKALEGTDYLTAIEWLDKVAEEEPNMAPIIKWCIFCLFEGKPNWADTTFIQAVYASVVKPLEMLLAPT